MGSIDNIIGAGVGILTLKAVSGLMKSGMSSSKGSGGKVKMMKIKWK